MKYLAVLFASLFLFACAPAENMIPGNGDQFLPAAYEPLADGERNFVESAKVSQARDYLAANRDKFTNQNYMAVVDFAQHSSQPRFTLIDLRSGDVRRIHVAHGSGSDPGRRGIPSRFSNVNGSKMSSVGFYRTAETYTGKNGLSLRIDGLSSTNSNARARAVVVHGSDYVYESDRTAGMSWGCPALARSQYKDVISKLKGGALLYIAQ